MSSNEPQVPHAAPANISLSRIIILTSATTLILTSVIFGAVLFFAQHKKPAPTKPTASANPFASKTLSQAFPLYYTTKPPAGYAADPNSVSQPHDGVILFNLVKGTDKIVITEEARTDKMVNLGAFYQSLKDSKQVAVSDGSIATGYFGTTRVASRANNKTWVLATTTATVSFDELRTMMEHLTSAP